MQASVLDAMPACAAGAKPRWCTTAGIALILGVPANRVRRTLCILFCRGLVTKHDAGWWSRHAPRPITAEECAAEPGLGRLGG